MGLGTEILFILMLGLLLLGPKQMHTLLGHMARAKAQLERRGAASSLSSRRNSMLRRRRGKLILRTNWLVTSELSSDTTYPNSEPTA